jgi:hypothetical protein
MPRYFFHVMDGHASIDAEGTELNGIREARSSGPNRRADPLRERGSVLGRNRVANDGVQRFRRNPVQPRLFGPGLWRAGLGPFPLARASRLFALSAPFGVLWRALVVLIRPSQRRGAPGSGAAIAARRVTRSRLPVHRQKVREIFLDGLGVENADR